MYLLKTLCAIHAPSGNESTLKNYILNYINLNIKDFKVKPTIIKDGIQDCLILKFGTPKTAIFAHLDSIGFTCLLYTSPSPRDLSTSRMPSSA